MPEHVKAAKKEDNDNFLKEVIELVNDKFEWRLISEKNVIPSKINNFIIIISNNGKDETYDIIKKVSCDESLLMDYAMQEINKETSNIKLVLCHKPKEGSAYKLIIGAGNCS